jgi:hypothetical protein
MRGTSDGRKVNSIIAKANKSNVDFRTLLKLEQLAYRGFIEFLNEFGGGPEFFFGYGTEAFGEVFELSEDSNSR